MISKIEDSDKNKVRLENNIVYISNKIYKKYHVMFYHNAKGAENRAKVGKFFHFDHNPSNKKVLELLNEKIKQHRNEDGFLDELTEYIKTIQTIDLITIYEDDIRTRTDLANPSGPLLSSERDALLNTKFYKLIDID